ncbi:autotransporter domain-containing protein [Bradyrhizobium sp. INPA01-394B]|uniref:Autotransporter domain-containing protein n=1 Tax=Bradyrhizobium campsiandrae TaxID=1729892 RepID=A0ABR7UIW5_9BRAD|nr:autotransporter domain-containing protein [Bradyrhizobium campsiandrae]MBC9879137.1 autotransporter domain-containing protein [Bradyrhizobium campsiandrae]MBC9983797.1 autotransporter domain-containing protein [Bradyrhizobium campsiandrae]
MKRWLLATVNRRLLQVPASALLLAPLLVIDRAEAACTPVAPVSNATIVCSGNVDTQQGGVTGYGTITDDNNTYQVAAGATVHGSSFGITTGSGGVLTNLGTIDGPNGAGLRAGDVTVSNAAGAMISGFNGITAATLKLDNAGTITSGLQGHGIDATTVTVSNSGTIIGIGTNSIGISATTVTVTANTGTISGVRFGVSTTADATIANGGSITATGANGTAVVASGNASIDNHGIISALAAGGIAVNVFGSVTMTANSSRIEGDAMGVSAGTNATVNNTGMILANAANGVALRVINTVTVANAGDIKALGAGSVGILAGTVVLSANSSLISGGRNGISANTATITNSGGSISALDVNGIAINAVTATVTNAGSITAAATGGVGIHAGTVNVTANTGLIAGESRAIMSVSGAVAVSNNTGGTIQSANVNGIAISAVTDANIANAGTIKGGTNGGRAVSAGNSATIANASGGLISAGQFGVSANLVTMNNAGIVESTGFGAAVDAQTANVTNSGTLRAVGENVVQAVTAVALQNSGTISGTAGANGIFSGGRADVVNSGSISAKNGILTGGALNLTNMAGGTIAGTIDGVFAQGAAMISNAGTITGGPFAIATNSTTSITNTGTISGNVGIRSSGAADIVNAGTITGTSGTAIKLTSAADTLTLLPGSKINGVVDFGFGHDVVNVNLAPTSRVSSLTSVTLPTFANFEGTINTITSGGSFNGPSVVSGSTLATLDPTALAQTDRTLMDFTGGVSSLVQGRLNGGSGGAGSNMMAMAYAPETAQAGPFTKAPKSLWTDPAPITVWANSFGGQRIQDETASTLRATSTAWGGAVGIDRKVQPNWLVGAFLGGGQGGLSVDLNSQSVDTAYVFGGAYSRFEWAAQFFDFTLQGGSADNKSRRLVLNGAAVGGMETATASYSGWYISPELAYGYKLEIGNGYLLTPTARLRYVAGRFDGYSETGSAQGLSVGGRTLQDIEERGEVDLSRVTRFDGGELKANIHGGVIALQRVGDTTINTVLLGQTLSFVTPGSRSTVGAVAGFGLDYRTSRNLSLFGAVEGMMMSDQSRTGTAKGGLRVAF